MANVGDMNDKVCIVTGANSGIGLETAAGLVERGATVILACRNLDKGREAQTLIADRGRPGRIELRQLDLASHSNIRAFANGILRDFERLDVLVNNAAIVPKQRELTEDGIEKQFGVNHLGCFLLTNLLLDRLKACAPSRIVTVSSTLHQNAKMHFDDLQMEENYAFMRAYGQSKLANILFTYELARRLEGTGVTANCLHPGGVRTNLLRDVPGWLKPIIAIGQYVLLSPKRGARTSVYLASSPEVEGVTGRYFANCKPARSSARSMDTSDWVRLWDESARLVQLDA